MTGRTIQTKKGVKAKLKAENKKEWKINVNIALEDYSMVPH